MPRRREIPKREIAADPLYDSPLVTKFINCVMTGGKRATAERILYKSFDIIKEKTSDDPLKVFKKAIENVKPSLEVKSRRVGGSNYQVPVEVNPNRRLSLAIRCVSSRFFTAPPRRFAASSSSLASFSYIVLPSPRAVA